MLETLDIENFGRHEKLNVVFKPGLNGIIGLNGKGKSTILSAAATAITGTALSDSNLQAEVRSGATTAKIKLTMRTIGGELEIKRSIGTTTKSRVSVKHPSGSSDKAAESLDIILKALDTNVYVIYNNVFARQGKIDQILDLTATTRLKELQQVFNLEQSEQAHKLLGVEISQYVVTPGLADTLKSSTEELAKTRGLFKEAESLEQSLRKQVQELSDWAQDIIARQTSFLRHQVSVEAAKQLYDDANSNCILKRSELANAVVNKTKISTSYVDCTAETLAAANAKLDKLREAMASYSKYQMLLSQSVAARSELDAVVIPNADLVTLNLQIEDIKAKLGNAKNILDGNIAKDKDPLASNRQAVDALKEELKAKTPEPQDIPDTRYLIQKLNEDLVALNSVTATCPTCKRTMDGVDPSHLESEKVAATTKLAEAKAKLVKLVTEHAGNEERRQTAVKLKLVDAESALTTAETKLRTFFTSKVNTFNEELQPLETLVKEVERAKIVKAEKQQVFNKSVDLALAANCPKVEIEELTKIAARTEHISTGIQVLREADIAVTNARAASAKVEADLVELSTKYIALSTAVVVSQPSTEDVEQARKVLEQVRTMQVDLSNKQSEAGQLKAQVTYLESTVARLSEQLAKEAKDAAWVSVVQQARDALHVSNYPADVMREYTSVINRRIAYYLDILEAEFSFYLDPDTMGFVAKFPDGRMHEGARLSGAQRVIAGMCFRLALADTFARSVGFLCLDEPSAYMDPDSIQSLQNLFLRLKSFASSQNRQIILITHERAFMSSMDHVIEVS